MTTSSLAGTHPLAPASTDAELRVSELVRRDYVFVWRLLRRFGVPESDADDAAQQVFLILASRIDRVPEVSERSFLVGVALRVASNSCRKAHYRRETHDERSVIEAPDPTVPLEEALDQRRSRELLDLLLAQMPEDLRTVFVLYEIEQLTMQQIAELLTLPVGTVGSRLRRAREDFGTRVHQLNTQRTVRRGTP